MPIRVALQNTHLLDRYVVQLDQPSLLRHPVLDENSIQVLQVGKTYQLVDRGIIADVAFQIRIVHPPLFCRHPDWLF